MDPLSQGVLGATWAVTAAAAINKIQNKSLDKNDNSIRPALIFGFLAGLAADLDVFIRSGTDPLLALEFHRHFTHSLAFIPFGALLCALVFYPFAKRQKKHPLHFKKLYLYCFAGYASHGFLDACTSYGTQLLWPFSIARVAWDIISIIDPLFTLPLIVFLMVAYLRRSPRWGVIALIYSFSYLMLGMFQRDRALELRRELAGSRGHHILRVQAKPSLGNIILFRGLYETQDAFYTEGIRVPLWGKSRVYEGQSLPKIEPNFFEEIPAGSALARDVERFTWFSDGFIVWHPQFPYDGQRGVIGDFRYSMLPTSAVPLWGIEVDLENSQVHAPFNHFRDLEPNATTQLKNMLFGR